MNEQVEVLFCRVVGREDAPEDWRELRQAARSAPELWAQLADDLEADAALRARLQPDLAAADRVPLPPAPAGGLRARRGSSGWLCAAALALLWLWSTRAGHQADARPEDPPPTDAVVAGVAVTELPRVVLDSRATAAGVEVVYVRRIVERATVRDLMQVHRDEAGQPFASVAQPAAWRPPESF